ncbi:MAG: hypothetical protein IT536_12140 [Hyphomicrobiales bacterium]|nr:hypothetical protein [Hyphomicrobiales bacterium]
MLLTIAGLLVLALTFAVFVALLPRGGKTYRLAGTELEPYVGVAITAAIALGFSMTLAGLLNFSD